MSKPEFDNSVFVNCPLDEYYGPILEAVLFCIVYLGLFPRLATERTDSAENRLDKICELIEQSRFSIHDLSRCQARKEGEHFRLNMPFELGIDFGCRRYFGKGRNLKKALILEEKPYRYQTALSDLSGCDIHHHGGNLESAVRKVRNWLVNEAGVRAEGATGILDRYDDFRRWHYRKQIDAGFSDEDIRDYPTRELLEAMWDWIAVGRPTRQAW